MIEFLTHPYVIILIVVSVIIGNIMLLKYTANLGMKKENNKTIEKPSEQENKSD